jgi:hypothetical protein
MSFRPDICTAPANRLILGARFKHDVDCGICLGTMQGTLVRRLPCEHVFHESCHARLRDAPGRYRYLCPVCRADYTGQIQRMKMCDIWEDEVGAQMRRYVRSSCTGGPPWETEDDMDRVYEFHDWLWNGASEEELAALEAALEDLDVEEALENNAGDLLVPDQALVVEPEPEPGPDADPEPDPEPDSEPGSDPGKD